MSEDNPPVFNLDHEQVDALFNPEPNVGDIKELQEWFLARAVRGGLSLPFPSDIVIGITDSQVSDLQSIFDIPEGDRYSYWKYVYAWALRRYGEASLTREASVMEQKVREAVPACHLPEVFFLVATSRYRKERVERELPDKKGGMWVRANRRAQDNAKKITSSIRKLEKVLSLMDEGAEEGRMTRLSLPHVARWCKEHDFREKLAQLSTVVEDDQKESQALLSKMSADVKEDSPREIAKDMPDCVYRAVDRVASIMGEIKGTKTMKISAATQLFDVWDIVVDQGALKVARGRRKKG
ncbi:MAG: hypothetical protein O2910_02565 [Proteobacteria bacterium]|nr:hypothetical protein [Pseudomonadota bacterium]